MRYVVHAVWLRQTLFGCAVNKSVRKERRTCECDSLAPDYLDEPDPKRVIRSIEWEEVRGRRGYINRISCVGSVATDTLHLTYGSLKRGTTLCYARRTLGYCNSTLLGLTIVYSLQLMKQKFREMPRPTLS